MRYKTVIVPFPFDDLSGRKARPAVCLTNETQPYGHIVLAFITSRVSANPSATDFVIDSQDADFAPTGLKVSSTVRLHRLMTVSSKLNQTRIWRVIENSADSNQKPLADIIRNLKNLWAKNNLQKNRQSLQTCFQFQIKQLTSAKRLAALVQEQAIAN